MAHGTLINGIQRNITGGFTLVNGVERKITKGLTLVNGVQREIKFAQKTATVKITGNGVLNDTDYAYVKINNVTYTGAATLEVDTGTQINCYTYNLIGFSSGPIMLNGKTVAYKSYSFACEADTTIKLNTDSAEYHGIINITTT